MCQASHSIKKGLSPSKRTQSQKILNIVSLFHPGWFAARLYQIRYTTGFQVEYLYSGVDLAFKNSPVIEDQVAAIR